MTMSWGRLHRKWRLDRVPEYYGPQSHLQAILGSVEFSNDEGWDPGVSLTVIRWKVKTVQTVPLRCKVKETLGELQGGSSEGSLGDNKPLDKVRLASLRNDAERCCQLCDTCAAC
jgi:hypothetical protein